MLFNIKNRLLKNKLLKETFWSFATKGITFILFISINVFLARSLGAEKFGFWSFFYSIISVLFMISYFGINTSARKYAAQYNKTNKLKNVIRDSFKLRFLFSFIFALFIFISSKKLAILVDHSEFEILFQYSAPFIFFMGFVEYFKQMFIGLHRIVYNFIINFLEYGLKLIFILVLFYFSINLLNIIKAFTLATFSAALGGSVILYFIFYKNKSSSHNCNLTLDIFKYSVPLFFISIGFLIATELDVLMLGFLSTNREVGIYAVAKQITMKLPQISLAIAMGTMPVFAKLTENNREKLKKLFFKLLKINALIFSIIVGGILSFSWYFIPLIFGIEYRASVLPLRILTVYLLCFSFSIFLGSFLDYQGLAKKRAINLFIATILNITLNFILIPHFGAVGAATATSVSYLPYIVLNWLEVRKLLILN